MSEPTYGSQYDPQQGYGGQQYGGQQYGGPPSGQSPYPTGQQPQQPAYGGGYGQQPPPQQQPGGYPSGGYPSSPAASKAPQDKLGLAATVLTIVGYVCAGAGVLGFILYLATDGDGIERFAAGLTALVLGIGLGGINYALGTWLSHRTTTTP
jgi:hypothetical protein